MEKVWHEKDEFPKYYPETTAKVDGDLILIDEHSEHYVPTEQAKEELKKKIDNSKKWAYLSAIMKNRGR